MSVTICCKCTSGGKVAYSERLSQLIPLIMSDHYQYTYYRSNYSDGKSVNSGATHFNYGYGQWCSWGGGSKIVRPRSRGWWLFQRTERNGTERNNGLKCGTDKSWNMEGKGSNCMCRAYEDTRINKLVVFRVSGNTLTLFTS